MKIKATCKPGILRFKFLQCSDTVGWRASSLYKLCTGKENFKIPIRFSFGGLRETLHNLELSLKIESVKRPASVAQVTDTQCAPTGTVYRRNRFNSRVGQ